MERSRANKKKFQMRSPVRASIADFMAMGRTLGNSNVSKSTAVDLTQHYKAPPKEEEKEEESSVDELKRRKAEGKLEKMNAAEKLKEEKKKKKQDDLLLGGGALPNEENEIKLNTSNNHMSAISAFPMKYGRKK